MLGTFLSKTMIVTEQQEKVIFEATVILNMKEMVI